MFTGIYELDLGLVNRMPLLHSTQPVCHKSRTQLTKPDQATSRQFLQTKNYEPSANGTHCAPILKEKSGQKKLLNHFL